MKLTRRATLALVASSALTVAAANSSFAQDSGSLTAIKDRGVLAVGVTQAPPWYLRTEDGPMVVGRWDRHGQSDGSGARG